MDPFNSTKYSDPFACLSGEDPFSPSPSLSISPSPIPTSIPNSSNRTIDPFSPPPSSNPTRVVNPFAQKPISSNSSSSSSFSTSTSIAPSAPSVPSAPSTYSDPFSTFNSTIDPFSSNTNNNDLFSPVAPPSAPLISPTNFLHSQSHPPHPPSISSMSTGTTFSNPFDEFDSPKSVSFSTQIPTITPTPYASAASSTSSSSNSTSTSSSSNSSSTTSSSNSTINSPNSFSHFVSKSEELKKMLLNDIKSTNESNLLINNFISFQNNLILDIINKQNNEIQLLKNEILNLTKQNNYYNNQNDQVAINYYVKTEQIYQKLKKFKTVFDEFVCSICLDNITDHSLGPCGHLLCGRCSNLVTHCPLCRVQVTSKLKIILPVNVKYDEKDFEIDDL